MGKKEKKRERKTKQEEGRRVKESEGEHKELEEMSVKKICVHWLRLNGLIV